MRLPVFAPIAAVTAALLLAACTDPALMPSPAVAPVTEMAADTIYAARADDAFTLPALPVEEIPADFQRQVVAFETDQAANTVIINPAEKHLYLVLGNGRALRYGIAVGRSGFLWSGEAVITSRQHWPTWTPPPEMIARRPELEKFRGVGQPGGPTNPLGARALYLQTNGIDYGYRIHGTPEYERVPDGSKVIVLTADGQMPTGLTIPPVVKPKKVAPPPPPPPPPVEDGVGPV
jgi:lipoprotein-anchoring transpeptidase ErfK/SrfK